MVENIGKTYLGSLVGSMIQFGLMLMVYSWLTQTQINIIIFLGVALIFGLIFAPFQLLLNSKDGDD